MQSIRIKSFISRVKNKFDKAEKKATTMACIHVTNEAKKKLSHKGTGRLYTSREGKGDHRASAEGEPPASDTGQLRRTVGYDVKTNISGYVGRVGTPEKYGLELERGTSRIAPRPWLKPTEKETRKEVRKIFIRELR